MDCDDYDDRKTKGSGYCYTVNPCDSDEAPVFHYETPRAVGPLSVVDRLMMLGISDGVLPWYGCTICLYLRL